VARVAAALAIHTDEARLAIARRKPLVSLEAYECWLRGRECLQRGTVEADAEARRFFERALEIDPHFARAHAGLSLSHFNEWSCQAWVQWDEKERLAYTHAARAAELDNTDAMDEIVLGRIMLYRRRFDEAAVHVDRALALNPSDADVLAHGALCRAYLGDGASGVELADKARRALGGARPRRPVPRPGQRRRACPIRGHVAHPQRHQEDRRRPSRPRPAPREQRAHRHLLRLLARAAHRVEGRG
jgi:tetratricopeptide (TPR) repeat protein